MSKNLSAGSFETELAKRLALLVKREGEVTEADVADCYTEVATLLGLAASPADKLHIRDIYAAVASGVGQARSADLRALERKIFDMIYMH